MAHDHEQQTTSPLIPAIGTVSQVERMFRVNWVTSVVRSPSGIPMLPAEFVARVGRSVRLVDVRERDELVGPLGHIPGVDWVPREHVPSLLARLDHDAPIVLVSRGGERSGELATQLEGEGMRLIASLEGGMVSWKGLGFGTSRNPEILERRDQLRTIEPAPEEPGELTVERIERHVGDPASVRFVKLAALMLHGRLSCVDGRDETGVIGTLGGDAGEFLLMLGAIERTTGKNFSLPELRALFSRRLDALGRFYLHTDVDSANALIKSMRSDPRLDAALADVSETLEWRRFLAAPPMEVRDIVLEHMAQPAHLGCGHVRMMWKNSESYGVRPELTRDFIRTFLTARWNGAIEAELVPLPGGHAERAVLRVFVAGELHSFTQVPLVSPSCNGAQMFVCHPRVVELLRRQLVAFALQQNALVPAVDPEVLSAELDRMAEAQSAATLGVLAKGLPIFDVTHAPGVWEVVHAGNVG
ncbi:MAG: rhodanese-like domain-containing protein [Deltaproteobacteria bacterium]|nr:rhodanese-like domain-containing protein [Nannocystaceae bacterium]